MSDSRNDQSAAAAPSQNGVPPPCVVGVACHVDDVALIRRFVDAIPADAQVCVVALVEGVDDHDAVVDTLRHGARLPVRALDAGEHALEPHTVCVPLPKLTVTAGHNSLICSRTPQRAAIATPVDQFLRSLATEKRQRAIGVLLSGSGTDGVLGLRSIAAEGGVTLVHTDDVPKQSELLRSAVRTGIVDYVLAAERMPTVIHRYTQHPYVSGSDDRASSIGSDADLNTILTILRARVGYNFHCYKKNTLARRVQRRMGLGQFPSYAAYAEQLRTSREELDELFNDLLICVTKFFRDREAWEVLRAQVIAPIVASKRIDEPIRVWVPGCATGEEAYTLAMLFLEEMRLRHVTSTLQVFASDINEGALEFARVGMYPTTIVADVPKDIITRYFTEIGGDHHFCVNKTVREAVIFAHQNLVNDPPFSKLDLITCRNLLIYLEPDVQQKEIALFHFAIRSGGYLFLGSAETLGRKDGLFTPLSKKWRIYQRNEVKRRDGVQFPIVPNGPRASAIEQAAASPVLPEVRLARMAQQLILEHFAPATVLVTHHHEIIYFSGPTHEYLVQPTGAPTNDLLAMAREGIRTGLRGAIARAHREGLPLTLENLRVKRDDQFYPTRVTVNPVRFDPSGPALFLVVFQPASAIEGDRAEPIAAPDESLLRQLEYELQLTRDELQSHIEELETSNEELKAANEEVMSINEELQSANEELETSKEELQSLNEELSTVNHQLQEKLEELEQTNDDLHNLLTSTDIATVFLDRELRIKRFTPAIRRLLNIIPSDIGRPLGDFTQRFTDTDLLNDARRVLEDLSPAEFEVRTESGRWFLRRVLPYRTEDNRIAGVVITFIDVTDSRRAADALAESEDRYRTLIDASTDFAIFMLDPGGRIATWNTGAERILGYTDREAIGRPAAMIFVPEDRAAGEDRKELERARTEGRSEDERWHLRKDGSRFWGSGVVTLIFNHDGDPVGFSKVMRDQTERRRIEAELKQLTETLEQMVAERTGALRALSSELLLAEERERRDLANDLHDSIGQTLALAAIRLSDPGELDAERREDLRDLINQANDAVRSVTMQLSPPVLYQIGLVPALEWLVEEMERRYGLAVVLDAREIPDEIDEQVRFILFRSTRELLINVAKHAGVPDARVRIGSTDEQVVLEIEDNGRGFTATGERIARREGFGLFSLRERIGYIGGEVTIRSTPGIGTTVTLRAPLRIQQP